MYTHTAGEGTQCQTSTHVCLIQSSVKSPQNWINSGRSWVKMAMSSRLKRIDGNPSSPFKIKGFVSWIHHIYHLYGIFSKGIWHYDTVLRFGVNIHMEYNESLDDYVRCGCCSRLCWSSRFYFNGKLTLLPTLLG